MERLAAGAVDPRTGRVVQEDYANWTTHSQQPDGTAGGRVTPLLHPGVSRRRNSVSRCASAALEGVVLAQHRTVTCTWKSA